MPSTENAALQLIQQEIEDVLERERELKKHYINNNNNNNNSPLESNGNGYHHQQRNGNARPVYARAKSTSALEETGSPPSKPSLRRFVSTQPPGGAKGVMHRFFKTRGRLMTTPTITTTTPSPNTTSTSKSAAFSESNNYDLQRAKVEPGQRARKGYVSAEVKIQRDIEETYKRETELKTLRRSQSNLAFGDDVLDAPLDDYLGGGALRVSKSLLQLWSSSEETLLDDAIVTSAPPSLKSARSLAQLPVDDDDDDATTGAVQSPKTLIRFFERMNLQNVNTKPNVDGHM